MNELRDILHAEKQLLKALPKMAKAARSAKLRALMEALIVKRLKRRLSVLAIA